MPATSTTTATCILAVMQNQWFHNPERVKAAIARAKNPEAYRRRMIEWALFAGCKSGRVLKRVFGEHRCEEIIWEESSREIGSSASSVFPADVAHLRNVLQHFNPAIVLGFGKVACDGLRQAFDTSAPMPVFIEAPHPTARQTDVMERLWVARRRLDDGILKAVSLS
jgi:hypothetical protein